MLFTYLGIQFWKEDKDEDPEYVGAILGMLNILSWVRGVSFLRVFKKTRALIRLLTEVL